MKSFFNAIIYLLFCSVLLVSCNSRKPLEPERITETRTVTKIIRDTMIQVQADSTYYDAWIECVNGKPVLKEPVPAQSDRQNNVSTPGKGSPAQKALQKPKVTLDENGKLTVECYKEVEKVKAQLIHYYEEKLKEHRQPVYIEKPLTWYQKSLMWLGGIFLILIAITIIIKFKK